MLCTAAINTNTVGEDSINLDPKVLISTMYMVQTKTKCFLLLAELVGFDAYCWV